MKELIIDFRRHGEALPRLNIVGEEVERVLSFKLLSHRGPHEPSTPVLTAALFSTDTEENNLSAELLKAFYHCCTESTLTNCLTSWYANCTVADRKSLQCVIHTSQKIIGRTLPTLEDIFRMHCPRRATNILRDATHPCHHLFSLLPSGWCYRAVKARTSRLKNSFVQRAISELNMPTPFVVTLFLMVTCYLLLFIIIHGAQQILLYFMQLTIKN